MHCCLNGTLIVHGGMVSRKVRASPELSATDNGDFYTLTLGITRFTKSFVNFYTRRWKITIILIVSFLTSAIWDLSIETIWATYSIRVLRALGK